MPDFARFLREFHNGVGEIFERISLREVDNESVLCPSVHLFTRHPTSLGVRFWRWQSRTQNQYSIHKEAQLATVVKS